MKLYRLEVLINEMEFFPFPIILKINTEDEWKIFKSAIIKTSIPNDIKIRKLHTIRRIEEQNKEKTNLLIGFPNLQVYGEDNISKNTEIIKVDNLCMLDEIKSEYKIGDIIAAGTAPEARKIIYISKNEYKTETDSGFVDNWRKNSVYGTLKQITEIVEVTKDNLLKAERNRNVRQVREIQNTIYICENDIKRYENCIEVAKSRIKANEEKLNSLNIANKEDKYNNIYKEIEKIKSHKLCEDVNVNEEGITIVTKHLYITEPCTNRKYSLGSMMFIISLDKSKDIQMYNLLGTRDAYSANQQHPHIFQDGLACFGTATKQVAYFRDNNEYMALYLTLVNFCQTVDIEDTAGWYVSMWDEVDENNEIIRKGHYPDEEEYGEFGYGYNEDRRYCAICNNSYNEEDMYYCEACEEYICPDCWDNNKDMCKDCAEHYSYCNECDAVVYNDDLIETKHGEHICSYCFDRYYHRCAKCGAIDKEEDMIYNEETGLYYCEDCAEEREE